MDPAKERQLIVLALKRLGGPLTGFIASRLPLNVGVETFRVPGSEEAIATEILRVAASMGDVIEAEPPQLSWLGRGLARNPAVVTVTMKPLGSEVEVTVRAAAAEGLLKQRAGEKTAAAVAERLQLGAG